MGLNLHEKAFNKEKDKLKQLHINKRAQKMTKSLKRKKRATKLLSPTNPSSRPVRKRRQPEYLKDYHLGTLPLETPIRNTDLPPAHSNVCILCRMFH